MATVVEPLVVARPERGARVVATVRGHRVETDQTHAGGGDDSAAAPLELLSAALATCIALYVSRFCSARGFSADDVAVEVMPEFAQAPSRLARFDVRVSVPHAMPTHYRELVERVARTCPVHNTLMSAPDIDVQLVG